MGLLNEVHSSLSARFVAQFAEHKLDAVQFETLVRLARSPGGRLRMSDLSNQTGLSTSGVTRVVDRLERAGLVERRACPTDRRGSFTAITELGLTRVHEVLPGHLELIDAWFTSRLSPAELDDLLRALRRVRDVVRPEATSGA